MQPVKVEAIIRPEKFEEVKRSLEEAGYMALTVYEVRGRGEQRGIELEYRGHRIRVELLPKLRLEHSSALNRGRREGSQDNHGGREDR